MRYWRDRTKKLINTIVVIPNVDHNFNEPENKVLFEENGRTRSLNKQSDIFFSLCLSGQKIYNFKYRLTLLCRSCTCTGRQSSYFLWNYLKFCVKGQTTRNGSLTLLVFRLVRLVHRHRHQHTRASSKTTRHHPGTATS